MHSALFSMPIAWSAKNCVQGLEGLICVFEQGFSLAEGKGAIDRTNNNDVCVKINLQNI